MHWTAESVDDFSDQSLEPNAQALFTMSLTGDFPSPSIQRNSPQDQYSQEGQGHVPGYRHLVATDTSRRAANARRRDPTKRGAHICPYCGNDFTALHNLNCTTLLFFCVIVLTLPIDSPHQVSPSTQGTQVRVWAALLHATGSEAP
jgi:hypothetical protein